MSKNTGRSFIKWLLLIKRSGWKSHKMCFNYLKFVFGNISLGSLCEDESFLHSVTSQQVLDLSLQRQRNQNVNSLGGSQHDLPYNAQRSQLSSKCASHSLHYLRSFHPLGDNYTWEEWIETSDCVQTFKVLENLSIPERKGLFQLLVQHAVDGDEVLIQSQHVWETHGGGDHALRPADRSSLRHPLGVGKHSFRWDEGKKNKTCR